MRMTISFLFVLSLLLSIEGEIVEVHEGGEDMDVTIYGMITSLFSVTSLPSALKNGFSASEQ